MISVLVLGGTGEGRALAAALAGDPQVRVISSLAGRVRNPALPAGEYLIGGFGGPAGLAAYLRAERIDRVVDATHPYAVTMSGNAITACEAAGVPLLALQRPGWQPGPQDDWIRVPTTAAAAASVRELTDPAATVFVTTGRRDLAPFCDDFERTYLIRAVDPPEVELPSHHVVVLDRGPYTAESEFALMENHQVAAVVTKDSGGTLTAAKLEAARVRAIPVVMVDRPALVPPTADSVATVEAALAWLGR